jgi:hypothetical protein
VKDPDRLDSASLYRQLISPPRRAGPAAYGRFVAQGRGLRLWEESLAGQIYLGDEAFRRSMQAKAPEQDKEIPRAQRRSPLRPLSWYFAQHDRDTAIVRAYREGGYTQTAIAKIAGRSVSRISRLLAANEAKGKK